MNERPGVPLRIAVLGDFEGIHTRRWLEFFVERGHEMHAISFYEPKAELPGVDVHLLSRGGASSGPPRASKRDKLRRLVPRDVMRLLHARRYARAGLRRVLDELRPDVFHAHYVVEHGFYGSFANFHPYVVSAWGSDLLLESRTFGGRRIARRALGRADLVTANDISLACRAKELGVPEERLEVVHLGIDPVFLEAGQQSVNIRGESAAPAVISDRALEPLYNVDSILRAFASVRAQLPDSRLAVAGDGSERERLIQLSMELGLGDSVVFMGRLGSSSLAGALAGAHVYVSVPSSDSLALSTVEAMAAGCFPVVSDLPSNEGWISAGENGLTVPRGDDRALAEALYKALSDGDLRRAAVEPNQAKVEAEGLRERTMSLMERQYYRLAGHPVAGMGEAI